MPNARRMARVALLIADVSSVTVAALLGGAALGIGVDNMRFHPTPRINFFTVGLGLVPVSALAWIVYLWTRKPVSGFLDIVIRLVVSCALAVGVYYAVVFAIFAATFVG